MATTRDSLLKFGDNFQANTGTVVSDLNSDIDRYLNNFNSPEATTPQKILGTLNALNSASPTNEINVEYLSKGGIKLGFPDSARDFSEQVVEKLNILLDALNVLKTVLEAVRDLIIGLSDLVAVLLEQIFQSIENLINTLTSVDAKVRVLPIPPIHPNVSESTDYSTSDKEVAKAFSKLITVAYKDTEITKAFPNVSTLDIEKMLLGKVGTSARYRDGSSGFLAAINDSFEDAKDPNRPVETLGFSGGIVIHSGNFAGAIDAAWSNIVKVALQITKDFKYKETPGPGPSVTITNAEHTGFNEQGQPTSRIRVNNPNFKSPKNLMEIPSTLYYPASITILYVQNTSESPFEPIRETGFQNLQSFKNLTSSNQIIKYKAEFHEDMDFSVESDLKKALELAELETLETTGIYRFTEQELELNVINDRAKLSTISQTSEAAAADVLYRVLIQFKKFELEGNYYVASKEDGSDVYITKISNPYPLHLPLDINAKLTPCIPSGPAPNWIQYGGTWQIPGISEVVYKLRDLLNSLKSFTSTTSNYLTAIVNTYINLIEKLTMLVIRLSNIVYIIDDFLDTNIGGNYFIFESDNGVSGIKKAINDHFEAEEEKFNRATSTGGSTSDIDWFGNGESVCGAVIVATSESEEKVYRLLELLLLIFGETENNDTSAQTIIPEEVLSTATFSLPGNLTDTFSLPGNLPDTQLNVPTVNLFTDNFTGVSSDRHTESPENACD